MVKAHLLHSDSEAAELEERIEKAIEAMTTQIKQARRVRIMRHMARDLVVTDRDEEEDQEEDQEE